MIYNTIMVQLDIDDPLVPRLSFAWEVARRFEADLVAFAAAEPRIVVPAGDFGIVAADARRDRIKEIEERLGALEGEFRRANYDENRVSWQSFVGNPTHFLALHSRAADLVVIGSSHLGSKVDHLRSIDPGALVLSAGRPILNCIRKPGASPGAERSCRLEGLQGGASRGCRCLAVSYRCPRCAGRCF